MKWSCLSKTVIVEVTCLVTIYDQEIDALDYWYLPGRPDTHWSARHCSASGNARPLLSDKRRTLISQFYRSGRCPGWLTMFQLEFTKSYFPGINSGLLSHYLESGSMELKAVWNQRYPPDSGVILFCFKVVITIFRSSSGRLSSERSYLGNCYLLKISIGSYSSKLPTEVRVFISLTRL